MSRCNLRAKRLGNAAESNVERNIDFPKKPHLLFKKSP